MTHFRGKNMGQRIKHCNVMHTNRLLSKILVLFCTFKSKVKFCPLLRSMRAQRKEVISLGQTSQSN